MRKKKPSTSLSAKGRRPEAWERRKDLGSVLLQLKRIRRSLLGRNLTSPAVEEGGRKSVSW